MPASGPPSSSPQRRPAGASAASGKPRRSGHLVGREDELARVADLVAGIRQGRSGALLVTGEAGAGKSSLLEQAAADATGTRTLFTCGVESEATLGHAGLVALLSPLRDHLTRVPEGQAGALGRALGWVAGAGETAPLLVAAGTLSLLSAAGEEGPTLVVVDDVHWLDAESRDAVLFALRRMRHDRVGFLLAARTGRGRAGLDDLPEVALSGLGPVEVRAGWPELTAPVAARLADETGGNPLVLSEVVPALSPAQRSGAAPLPVPLPVTSRPLHVLARRLEGLSPQAGRLLLLHACAGPGEEQLVIAAAAARGLPAAAADEAVTARALEGSGGRLRLAHPLLRGAVLDRAEAAHVRDAHEALAAAARMGGLPVAAAIHRAEAATGPDEALAAALAGHAEPGRTPGHAVASLLLERASGLTTDVRLAGARLARAAEEAFVAGDLARTRALADRALAAGPDDAVRAEVLFVLGTVEEYAGSVPRAAALLAEAAERADGRLRVRALAELGMTSFRLGDVAGQARWAARLAEVADHEDPYERMLLAFAQGWAALAAGDVASARPRLGEALELALVRPVADTQTLLVYQAGALADDVRGLVAVATAKAEGIRRQGAASLLVPALAMLSGVRAWVGDHRGAFADAGEAVELAGHLGHLADAASAHEHLAWQSAARGLHEDAAASLEASADLLERAGLSQAAAHHALTAAFCALSRDDPRAVAAVLEPRLDVDGGMGALGEPLGVAPLLVEAWLAMGRREDAVRLSRELDAVTPTPAPPMLEAPRQRCRALIATDIATSRESFEAALAAYEAVPDPFEVARTHLQLGRACRMNGDRTVARAHLDRAEAAFAGADLTAWAEKARAERAATGERARPRGQDRPEEPLTSQETRVALLVARGATNKEVAAQLFLSPRTVETHLAAVFRKRGYRNRAALAAALGGSAPPLSSTEPAPS